MTHEIHARAAKHYALISINASVALIAIANCNSRHVEIV